MNIHIEMPSGCKSPGYDPDRFLKKDSGLTPYENAFRVFDLVVAQLRPWKDFVADVILSNNIGNEVQRDHVEG